MKVTKLTQFFFFLGSFPLLKTKHKKKTCQGVERDKNNATALHLLLTSSSVTRGKCVPKNVRVMQDCISNIPPLLPYIYMYCIASGFGIMYNFFNKKDLLQMIQNQYYIWQKIYYLKWQYIVCQWSWKHWAKYNVWLTSSPCDFNDGS